MGHESITDGGCESQRRFEALRADPKSMRAKSNTAGFRFHNRAAPATVLGEPCLTIGSNRSLGRAPPLA